MVGKCFRRIFLSAVVALLIAFLLVAGLSQNYLVYTLTGDIKVEAQYAAHGINLAGRDYLELLDSTHRITLISQDGTVLFDNQYDTAELENHSDRAEVVSALTSGSGSIVRYSDTASEIYIYYAMLLDNGMVIRVSGANISLLSLMGDMVVLFLALTALFAVISYILARQISKSIRASAESIDLGNPVKTSGTAEFSPLLDKIRQQATFIRDQIAKLSHRQEEFSVITENMSEGFIVVNRQREILSYNSSAIRILGSGLFSGHPTVDALDSSEPLVSAVNTALSGRHNEQALELDGATYRIIANPVYHRSEITGVVIVILDVTEKENLEQMRREFTSNVSHELKTPLTSICGAAEMLESGLVKPEDVSSFAGTINREAKRLVSLIDDILQLSQLDEAGIVQEMTGIDLHAVCASVIERLSGSATRQGISLTLDGQPERIIGVPTIIDELVFNLCDNAIKYNRPSGSVTVTVGQIDGRPAVTVADTGIGIGREHIGRIFERFYRVDKSRSRAIGGTGLGLSIVKHAAARHNADILVDSEEGKGTTITILFQ